MILRAGERHRYCAITQSEERNLLTFKKLFNDDFRSLRDPRTGQKRVDCDLCLFNRSGDDDPLSRSKAISFNYDRHTSLSDILLCLRRIVESPKIACRDPKFAAEILGVCFRPFEPGRGPRRPAAQYACVYQIVCQTRYERSLGTDHHQINSFSLTKGDYLLMLG